MQLSQRQGGQKNIRIIYNAYSEKYTWKEHLYQIAVIFAQFIVKITEWWLSHCQSFLCGHAVLNMCWKLWAFFLPFALVGNVNAKFDFTVRCWIIFYWNASNVYF